MIDFFKNQNKNQNTDKATTNRMKRYDVRVKSSSHPPDLENLDSTTLNNTLETFFASVHKTNGKITNHRRVEICKLLNTGI